MSCKVVIDKKATKALQKLSKNREIYTKMRVFLTETLPNAENPCTLPNAKHLQGFTDNRYRWRLGDYRIIGLVKDGEYYIVQVIKIAKRDEKTYT